MKRMSRRTKRMIAIMVAYMIVVVNVISAYANENLEGNTLTYSEEEVVSWEGSSGDSGESSYEAPAVEEYTEEENQQQEESSYEEPGYEEPSSEEPVSEEPVSEEPVSEEPSQEASVPETTVEASGEMNAESGEETGTPEATIVPEADPAAEATPTAITEATPTATAETDGKETAATPTPTPTATPTATPTLEPDALGADEAKSPAVVEESVSPSPVASPSTIPAALPEDETEEEQEQESEENTAINNIEETNNDSNSEEAPEALVPAEGESKQEAVIQAVEPADIPIVQVETEDGKEAYLVNERITVTEEGANVGNALVDTLSAQDSVTVKQNPTQCKSIMYTAQVAAATNILVENINSARAVQTEENSAVPTPTARSYSSGNSAVVKASEMTPEEIAKLSAWLSAMSVTNGFTVYADKVNTPSGGAHIDGNFAVDEIEDGSKIYAGGNYLEGADLNSDGYSYVNSGTVSRVNSGEKVIGSLILGEDANIEDASGKTTIIESNDVDKISDFVKDHPEYNDVIDIESNLDKIAQTGEKLTAIMEENAAKGVDDSTAAMNTIMKC